MRWQRLSASRYGKTPSKANGHRLFRTSIRGRSNGRDRASSVGGNKRPIYSQRYHFLRHTMNWQEDISTYEWQKIALSSSASTNMEKGCELLKISLGKIESWRKKLLAQASVDEVNFRSLKEVDRALCLIRSFENSISSTTVLTLFCSLDANVSLLLISQADLCFYFGAVADFLFYACV